MKRRLFSFAAVVLALASATFGQVDPTQVDDFEDGTTMSWRRGPSATPPSNIADGGPNGAADRYMQVFSVPGGGDGTAVTVFNQAQWRGDFVANGIEMLRAEMANFGSEDLFMRIAIQGAGQARYGSVDAFVLPPDGLWRTVTFPLTDDTMELIEGSMSLSDTITNVSALRINSVQSGPKWSGDRTGATLGIDRIRVPEPASLTLVVAAGALSLLRRRSA